jgi:hypothetical protein
MSGIPTLKLGDHIKTRLSGWRRGRNVELRGTLGPHGCQICRVVVRRKPKPAHTKVREDQLQAILAGT